MIKYVGISERVAGTLSYLLRQLYWIKFPAYRNAKLLNPPTSSKRWPVTFFGHGLAGSRNAYSQICGDLASNGMVVVALDHRDGSSPIQYVRETANTPAHIVYPTRIPHSPLTDEVHEARDAQLRIRIWEICMAYEALMKIDEGYDIQNLDSNTSRTPNERTEVLWQFNGMLDIHQPGRVIWAGHSFGAATMVQLLKSIFYHQRRTSHDGRPLIVPNRDAAVVQQVSPESPALLLDMWCTPLKSPQQRFLRDRPLPSYAVDGPNGANVLSVLSESFHNWEDNLNVNKAIVAKPTLSRRPSASAPVTREKGLLPRSSADEVSPEDSAERTPGPHMFYVETSQHFNQSDYGIVFPWLAQKFTKAEEPERCLALNTRAMVQVLRESGVEVGGEDDRDILMKEEGVVRRWCPIPIEKDEEEVSRKPSALGSVDRRLSTPSGTSISTFPPGANDTPAEQEMEAQLSRSPRLERRATLRSPEIQAQMKRDTEEAEMSPTGTLTMGQKTDAQLQRMGSLELPGPA